MVSLKVEGKNAVNLKKVFFLSVVLKKYLLTAAVASFWCIKVLIACSH